MTKVRWTPQAADDLQAIFDFIARDSPHYAQLTVEEFLRRLIISNNSRNWVGEYQKALATIFAN